MYSDGYAVYFPITISPQIACDEDLLSFLGSWDFKFIMKVV